MDVMEFSQRTKAEADSLLAYGNVLETLSKYGKVILSGSYSYDLMWGPDIDITVLPSDPEQASHKALNDFINQGKFRKYQFGDFIKFPLEGRPQGTIIVLIHEFKGRKWEIEIWFDKKLPSGDVDAKLEKLLRNVSSKQKETILNLKHQREISNTSKHKIDSPTIYKGVLIEGKTSIQDF